VNFLPGPGSSVGDTLVSHPRTRFIAFTGSKDVGLHINELAAKRVPGQIWMKRVIAEMGGKDAIVVDSDVDLDAAVAGVVTSAFGYQGQKCSACSRAIVLESVYDAFLERLKRRVEGLTIGAATDPVSEIGPVITRTPRRRFLIMCKLARMKDACSPGANRSSAMAISWPLRSLWMCLRGANCPGGDFWSRPGSHQVKDFDEALAIANDTEYGLTGSVYSRDRDRLEEAAQEFFVGNLYFNRKCTGALVGGHPFGGFNMSGTDSKAGGRDYLLLFTQAKVISEKVTG